ncbi:hypothetical protein CHLRE_01g031250v5 [Chlamydomonas reinhardtii]|uniref:Uncharacterized protein n=1 Tax=Chlamydomonas reinhardtii TaxID=3055 RepID=A8HQJ9_CHLRE|nr:uncharacterized protein CHLRE_01g031250v5 [Chlamydomonas reinhardtii]PNW88476.1 hypothetical protein CHLRE_01g031250v5 [Chlamydomonas reinhardtii]|eukprot:XP_001689589.1 predicted protein [Chlamydomonas reinhardtii]
MASAPSLASRFSFTNLKAGLKKYGKAGIYTYFGLSTCVTASFYVAIESHVDVRSILGLKKASDEQEEGKEPSFVERFLIGKGSNLALAILCSKMLIPIKVPAAMALTPYVQRVLDKFVTKVPKVARP